MRIVGVYIQSSWYTISLTNGNGSRQCISSHLTSAWRLLTLLRQIHEPEYLFVEAFTATRLCSVLGISGCAAGIPIVLGGSFALRVCARHRKRDRPALSEDVYSNGRTKTCCGYSEWNTRDVEGRRSAVRAQKSFCALRLGLSHVLLILAVPRSFAPL
jgi:hypothetical protein